MKKAPTKKNMSVVPDAPSVGPNTSSSMSAQERKWKAEDALRDLTRAEEHRRDPALMKEVARMARDKMRDLACIKVEVAPKTIKGAK